MTYQSNNENIFHSNLLMIKGKLSWEMIAQSECQRLYITLRLIKKCLFSIWAILAMDLDFFLKTDPNRV